MITKKLKQEILQFLQDKPSYNAGLSLLMKLGVEKAILLELLGVETESKKTKLFSILNSEINESTESIPKSTDDQRARNLHSEENSSHSRKTVALPKSTVHISVDNRYRTSDSIPENDSILEQIRKKRAELYRLRSSLHNDLFHAVSNESRYPLCIEIMKLSKSIDLINQEYAAAQNGVIPERFVKVERTAKEYVEIDFTKKYISKYKKKVENADSLDKKKHYEELLAKHETKLNQLLNGK